MPLIAGTQFGDFQVTGSIGAGGMGEVYLARDTTLERDVAIKVLPQSVTKDADRIARFDREAKTLASLNHPNIAQVYGLQRADSVTAIIMELVEGPTLDERIGQGALPVSEATDIALQIAAALEAAHGQHIVHRDLKPQNIKVRADGTVKVLDFGIAKALEPDILRTEPPSPMLTTPATQVGVLLGTAAYMSPEQARGLPVDQRADIWAFGCVLYEMLTGQLAFGAQDAPTTLARVIASDVNLDALPASLSPAVRRTIELCLQKDRRDRLHDIGDARLALTGAFETTTPQDMDGRAAAPPLWRRLAPLGVALLAGLAIGIVYENSRPGQGAGPLPVNRFEFSLPEDAAIREVAQRVVALSPDGRRFVFITSSGFYLRTLSDLEGRVLPGTGTSTRVPTFSPDGQQLAYFDESDGLIKRVGIETSLPAVIATVEQPVAELSWATGEDILFALRDGIFRVSASGGTPELIVERGEGERMAEPWLLPDGDAVVYRSASAGVRNRGAGEIVQDRLVVVSLSSGEKKVLVESGNSPRYVPTGHLVFFRGGTLYAVPFDLERLEVTGDAVPFAQGILRGSYNWSPANYEVSNDGTLMYVTGNLGGITYTPVWLGRDGREQEIAIEPSNYVYPRISPDGRRMALDDRNVGGDVWVWDFAAETRTRLTTADYGGQYPVWTADSTRVAFICCGGVVESKAANNAGRSEALATGIGIGGPGTGSSPYFFSPAGDALVFRDQGNLETNDDIGMVALGGDSEPVWLLREPYNERNAELAPGGHWMAYQSDETGRWEIYVRPFPNVDDDRYQVSNAGGIMPRWSQDGKELFYLEQGQANRMIAVTVEATSTTFSFGQRNPLLDWPYPIWQEGRQYDVSPDGQRFLAIKQSDVATSTARIIIVQNWFEEIRSRMPTQ